jgi:hypothetical protein
MPSTKWPGVGKSSLRRARRIRAHKDEPRALLEAHFEERAAIFELDEDLPRAEAEAMARREMAAGIRKRAQAEHDATPYTSAVAALSAKCLAYVPEDRWRQAVEDATAFVSEWGARAQAFGWTARELFGLHTPPEWPHPTYSRLGRLDHTGLIWLLRGRPVVALTETTATIRAASGATLTFRRTRGAHGPADECARETRGRLKTGRTENESS